MLTVLEKCFPERMADWAPMIKKMVPSHGKALAENPALAKKTLTATRKSLAIT